MTASTSPGILLPHGLQPGDLIVVNGSEKLLCGSKAVCGEVSFKECSGNGTHIEVDEKRTKCIERLFGRAIGVSE